MFTYFSFTVLNSNGNFILVGNILFSNFFFFTVSECKIKCGIPPSPKVIGEILFEKGSTYYSLTVLVKKSHRESPWLSSGYDFAFQCGRGLIRGRGAKILHALGPEDQNRQYCNKFNQDFKNGPHQKILKRHREGYVLQYPNDNKTEMWLLRLDSPVNTEGRGGTILPLFAAL